MRQETYRRVSAIAWPAQDLEHPRPGRPDLERGHAPLLQLLQAHLALVLPKERTAARRVALCLEGVRAQGILLRACSFRQRATVRHAACIPSIRVYASLY